MHVTTPRRTLAIIMVIIAGCAVAAAEPTEGRTFAAEGAEIFYRVVGSGEPLLLLHSGTQSGAMWDEQIARLAARYQIIVPDLRGHGRSTNPSGKWSTRQFAHDIFGLLDHLGVERFRAAGASAGGMTLLHMAIAQPQRFQALIVVGVGTYLPASCRDALRSVDANDLPAPAWEQLRARHIHGDDQITALYDWVASLAEDETDMVFTPPQLARITSPTFVVHGDRDYCFPASMAGDIFEAIQTAYLWVVPSGSHVPILGPRSDQFVDHALEFLAGSWEHESARD